MKVETDAVSRFLKVKRGGAEVTWQFLLELTSSKHPLSRKGVHLPFTVINITKLTFLPHYFVVMEKHVNRKHRHNIFTWLSQIQTVMGMHWILLVSLTKS